MFFVKWDFGFDYLKTSGDGILYFQGLSNELFKNGNRDPLEGIVPLYKNIYVVDTRYFGQLGWKLSISIHPIIQI